MAPDSDPRPDAEANPGAEASTDVEGTDVEGLLDALDANPFEGTWNWRAGAVAGFAAAIVAGVAITVVRLETLRVAVAGLYGFEGSLLAGWVAHLAHGVVFGLVFAFVLSDPGFYHLSDWWWKTFLAAVVYSVVLAVAGAGIIMPIWLGFLGAPTSESLPHVPGSLLGWHVLYGAVLGVVYPFVEHRLEREDSRRATPESAAGDDQ